MTPNLVCIFLAMTGNAVHKNRYSTVFHFLIKPLCFYRAFLVRSITVSPYIQTWYECFLQWLEGLCTEALTLPCSVFSNFKGP